jgi:hypothetical protein
VTFQTRLAGSQRAFFGTADHDRLAHAAEDGRAAASRLRDRYLVPERISGHSLQQALNLQTPPRLASDWIVPLSSRG